MQLMTQTANADEFKGIAATEVAQSISQEYYANSTSGQTKPIPIQPKVSVMGKVHKQ